MSIAEQLAKFREQNSIYDTKLCKVGWWLLELNEEDKKEATALLFDTPMTGKEISKFLSTIGIDFSVETIRKHRVGECICHQQKA